MAFTTISITGTFHHPDGSNATGTVVATPSSQLQNGTTIIDMTPVVGQVTAGALTMSLVATDDTGTTPTGAYYTWVVQLDGIAPIEAFTAPLSHLTTPVDFSTFAPVVVSSPLSATFSLGALDARYAPASITGQALNVMDYGAVGDGVADDTLAWQNVIAALPLLAGRKTGAIISPPNKRFKITSLLNLDDTSGVTIKCQGGGVSADGGRPMLEWTPGAGSGPMIRAAGSYGLHLENLALVYSNVAYDGDLIKFGHSATGFDCFYTLIERCYISGIGTATLARSLVNVNQAILGTIRECQFNQAQKGLLGVDGNYAISWNVEQNTWNKCELGSIFNPGEGWHIHGGNAFEQRADGSPKGIIGDTNASIGVVIDGNWFGDVSGGAAGEWINLRGRGIVISGNRLHVEADASAGNHICLQLRNVLGCTIQGNNFVAASSSTRAIDFEQNAGVNCDAVVVQSNRFSAITQILNEANLTSGRYIGNVGLPDKSVPGNSTVASAANIAIPPGCPVVTISGTTNITSITIGPAGQQTMLIFQGALTFTDGSNLKLAGNFVTTADDTITLVSDGTNWFEVCRSVN